MERKNKARNIDFWGNFGTGNLGNERTLEAIIANLRKHLPNAEFRVICPGPEQASQIHHVRAFDISDRLDVSRNAKARLIIHFPIIRVVVKSVRSISREWRGWISAYKTLRHTDVLIMAGTGMLTDFGEGPLGLSYQLWKWSVIAKIRKCKLCFVSVGVEPTQRLLKRWLIKFALSLADYRSYRDNYSKRYLELYGFKTSDDPVYPDLAFSLATGRVAEGERKGKRPIIGVGVMNYHGQGSLQPGGIPMYEEYLKKTATFVKWLIAHDYEVRVLIGDVRYDASVKNDMRELLEKDGFKYKHGHISDEPILTIEDLIVQLAMTDIVVSPRYHNLLLATMMGKPVLSISYNEKNDYLLASMGLGDYCHRIDNLNVDKLIEQFLKLEKNASSLKRIIERSIEGHRKQLDDQYARLFAILASN